MNTSRIYSCSASVNKPIKPINQPYLYLYTQNIYQGNYHSSNDTNTYYNHSSIMYHYLAPQSREPISHISLLPNITLSPYFISSTITGSLSKVPSNLPPCELRLLKSERFLYHCIPIGTTQAGSSSSSWSEHI